MSYDEREELIEDSFKSVEAAEPLIAAALSEAQIEALRAPLDRDRVKRKQGKFSYLEAHDVIRTANRIFGFGEWGHEIVEQVEIAAVEVLSSDSNPRPGWHVGYRCVVRLNVRGCVSVCGSGFGDGVEYGGPRSRVSASELALKESESDALKRAFKNFGDQFGLILYAKDNERAAIEREQGIAKASPERREEGPPPVPVPRTWPQIEAVYAAWGEGEVEFYKEFLALASAHLFDEPRPSKLTPEQRKVLQQKAAGAAVAFAESHPGPDMVPPPDWTNHEGAWASVLDGVALRPVEAGAEAQE